MKFVRLLLKNLLRNRRRSLITLTTIAASLFLVATLATVLTELENPPETPDSALRLVTRYRVSLANPLPKSHMEKIARVEGVEAVLGSMWFGGVYQDPKNFFAQFSIDAERFFDVYPDVQIPEEQKQAWLADRTGAIVGENLAARFGWKLGDRIPLQGALFPINPELTIRGIYQGGPDQASTLYFHWAYFNESLKTTGFGGSDFTGTYAIRARSVDEVPRIAERVDALFANTSSPTKTESERAFMLGFVSMMGNVRFLITSISTAVIVMIVLVAANTMAMAIRERTREIGIMKALGFRPPQILWLLLGESVLLALAGALVGSFGARLVYARLPMAQLTAGFIQRFYVTPGTLALSAGIGVLVGVAAAGIPSWRAARRPAVQALRRVV